MRPLEANFGEAGLWGGASAEAGQRTRRPPDAAGIRGPWGRAGQARRVSFQAVPRTAAAMAAFTIPPRMNG
jgi:hypothetical protein